MIHSLLAISIAVNALCAVGEVFANEDAARASSAGAMVMSIDDLVASAIASNPQVRAAEAQYMAALHQVDQSYVPQDPVLNLQNGASPNGITHPAVKTWGVSESLQFPGKAWLQGDEAHRNAEIARLAYMAAIRDAKAQIQTAYYQTLLDSALADTALENASSLNRVLKVAQVAYAANQVTQSDLISAEFDLAQASQTFRASQVAEANDKAALNQALGRDPRTPLILMPNLDIHPLQSSLDPLLDKALAMRQELLEAALTEKNSRTALNLARMEFLPDFSVSYSQNHYLLDSASPNPGVVSRDNTAFIGLNVPIFFWFKQKEDIRSAKHLLEAARDNRQLVELQTKTNITQLYRSTLLAYETVLLYRDSLIPLARQNFQVALIAYQSRKVDFPTLSGTLQRIYNARISYLTAANQFLAGLVAMEQAVGAPISP